MVWRILCFDDGLPFPSPTMAGDKANRGRTDGAMEQRAAANLERSVPGGGCRFGERFQRLRVQHLAADWVDQQLWADKKSKERMDL
jgi:hypothetical protein